MIQFWVLFLILWANIFTPVKLWGKIPQFAIPTDLGHQKLTPMTAKSAQQKFIVQLAYDSLLMSDEGNNYTPKLAKSWEIDSKGKFIDFEIDTNQRFSDGSYLKLDDVTRSLISFCGKQKTANRDLSALKGCNPKSKPEVVKISATKVRFYLDGSPGLFLSQLAAERFLVFKRKNKNVIGTGAYMFSTHQYDKMKLEQNPFHSPLAPLPEFAIVFVDERKITQKLLVGSLDGAIMYLSQSIRGIDDKFYLQKSKTPTTTLNLFFNNKHPVFKDTRTRLKVRDAIRVRNINKCFKSPFLPNGIVPFGLGGSLTPFNREKIQSHTHSEHTDNKLQDITFYGHVGRINKCAKQKIIAAFRDAGFALSLILFDDYDKLWPIYLDKKSAGFVELTAFKYRDAYSILKLFQSNSSNNFLHLSSGEYDRWLIEANKALTRSNRFEAYKQANLLLEEQAHIVPISYMFQTIALSKSCFSKLPDFNDFNPFDFLNTMKFSEKGCH